MFSSTNQEDVQNKRFEQNDIFTTDLLNSEFGSDIEFPDEAIKDLEALLKEVEKMDLNFIAQTQMTLYGTSDSQLLDNPTLEYIISNNILLYESLEVAKIISKRDKLKALFKVTFNIESCMDTLNIEHLSRLEKYYRSLSVKQRKELDTQDKLLRSYLVNTKAHSYRYIKELLLDSALPNSLNLKYNYVAYRILNQQAIQDIEAYKQD